MSRRRTRLRGIGRRIGNVLLTLAAIGGAVCLALVPLAFYFDISLIMFKTGSMGPTIPAGSLAVVQETPASAIHVGDIVTVDRSPAPPVTHRVTSIAPGPAGARTITMRGDANPGDDPAPYVVTNVRRVLFSVPRLAYGVQAVSNPLVIGGVTLAAAALVTWAFWPRGESAPHLRRGPPRHAAMARHATTAGKVAVVALLAASAPVLSLAPHARAAETEDVVHGDVLTLTSVGDKARMGNLKPGISVPWQVGVAAHPTNPTTVRISLRAEGELVRDATGLHVTVSVCTVRWVQRHCPSGGELLRGPGPASALLRTAVELTSMPSDEQRWVLVDAALPAGPEKLPIGSAVLVLSATGDGEQVTTDGNLGPPASTGRDLWSPLLTGLTAVAVGLVLTAVARFVGVRQHRRDEVTT